MLSRAGSFVVKISILVDGFGSGDTPACPQCGAPTKIFGRETHPDLGTTYELQSFECGKCGHILTRSADKDGQPALE
jgi:predicted RNA-binding Zn-ribbon protein involved in translation (DUF1610 family)